MIKNVFSIILLTFLISNVSSQCVNNVIRNGSFELDTLGEGVTGKFWELLEGQASIDDASDTITPFGGPYKNGMPQPSSDGGNWQQLYCNTFVVPQGDTLNTRVSQVVELQSSRPHVLEFEFASLSFIGSNPELDYSAIEVLINDELILISKLDTTLYSFERESVVIVPNSKELIIEFRISKEVNPSFLKLVALDGVCLRPVSMGMFCDN